MPRFRANRLAFYVCLGCFGLLPSGGMAQGAGEYAPWMDKPVSSASAHSAPAHEEVSVKKLSLKDLENFLPKTQIPKKSAPLSAIEEFYATRVQEDISQFGYDLFSSSADISADPPAGKVSNDYILGPGDSLTITLRGQENVRQRVIVNSQGLLVAEPLAPVMAAGRTLRQVEAEFAAQAAQSYNMEIYLSLDGVRQIGVLVIGDVAEPGRKNLTAFHSVLDALNAAGGVRQTGTLRNIKLVRDGKSRFIDLYAVMMQGSDAADRLLQEGDRIIVPPLGATMAVAGSVKRPAIYELKHGQKLSLHEALGLAGGVLIPADNRFLRRASTSAGDEVIDAIGQPNDRLFGDGDVLQVMRAQARPVQDVTLTGETRAAGPHALAKAQNLSDLINDSRVLGDNIYPLIGLIERRDDTHFTRRLVEFSPLAVLHGNFDRKLAQGDVVHLFSAEEIALLDKSGDSVREAETQATPVAYQPGGGQNDLPEMDVLLASFLKERSVFVRGAVRKAGAYPVSAQATLEDVLAVAGGTTLEAAIGNIEITSRLQRGGHQVDGRSGARRLRVDLAQQNPRDIPVAPGDTVRVNQKFQRVADESVTLLGAVRHPGKYDLMPGDTLLSLMQRAGGVTEQAYPDGAIFSRKSERLREENRYRAQAQDLEMKLAAAMGQQKDDKKIDMAQIAAAQSLITQLKNAQAVGRITVEADPGSLKSDPDINLLLEAGDRIYIPQRPMSVRVAGEVLSPASLLFKKGKSASDYISEAGGTTYYADRDRAFVIYPDGSAKPLQVSMWNHNPTFIPPGSTIIVPRDPKPFDFLESAERVSQILANLAISGLYIEAIGDDD